MVYKQLHLFPLHFRDNGFVAVRYDFSMLSHIISVKTYPVLVHLANNAYAPVKGLCKIEEMRELLQA